MSVTNVSAAESRLLMVLLGDALMAVRLGRKSTPARAARLWICAPDAGADVGLSFGSACERLGIDGARLRRRIGLRAGVPRRRSARGFTRRAGR